MALITSKPRRIAIGVGFIILIANLNAIIDAVIHTEIPYFDEEHLIVGGIGSLLVAFFLVVIEVVLKRMERMNRELEAKVEERTSELLQTNEYLRESREHYRVIAESSHVGIWQMTPEGRTLFINPAMCQMLEIDDPGELESNRFESFVEPGSREMVSNEHAKHIMNISSRYEVDIRGKRGTRRTIIVDGAPLLSKEGRMESLLGIFLDITESKRTQDELKQNEEKYRRIFESIQDVYAEEALDGTILEISPSIKVLSGHGREDLLGKSIGNIYLDQEERRELIEELVRERHVNEYEVRLRDVHGREVLCSYSARLITGSNGVPEKIVGTIRDVTRRRRSEEEMRKLENRLYHAQKMEAVGQLAAGMAHDFNNILAIVMGYGNIVIDSMNEDDPLKTKVSHIVNASERGAHLVKSLLAFSRKQETKPVPVQLNELVTSLGSFLTGLLGKDITLNTVLPDGDMTVIIDREQIYQALINLAANAKDAMPNGGTLSIETGHMEMDDEFKRVYGYGESGAFAVLSITDTGTGMDAEVKRKLFQPFFTTKKAGKGTGLGLAMVFGTIKQNNGYIYVYSDAGVGSTFKIFLPVKNGKAKRANTVSYTGHEALSSTVLVVEDDDARQFTKKILEEAGCAVIEAQNGGDALDKFNKHKDDISLLLIDAILPGKNGKEVYEEIRKRRPGIKALFASGFGGEILKAQGIHEDGLSFILKPFHPRALLSRVREALDVDC